MSAEAPDRLDLIRAELRRAERALKFAKRMVAQEIDSKAADNDSRGGTRDDSKQDRMEEA